MKVSIKSEKNNLDGFIHKYVGSNPIGLVVLLPGFLDSKDYPHLVRLGEVLAERGYEVVRFDPTGVWKSEGRIDEYSIPQYLRDIDAVVSFMIKMRGSNYRRIILIGHSLGGMTAIFYTMRHKNIDGVVAIMSPYSQTDPLGFQEKLREWEKAGQKVSYRVMPDDNRKNRKFVVPYSYIIKAKKYNVLKVINDLHTPIIFLAGEKDDKVIPDEVNKIYQAANEPKVYKLLNGVVHDYRLFPDQVNQVNSEVINYLQKTLHV